MMNLPMIIQHIKEQDFPLKEHKISILQFQEKNLFNKSSLEAALPPSDLALKELRNYHTQSHKEKKKKERKENKRKKKEGNLK